MKKVSKKLKAKPVDKEEVLEVAEEIPETDEYERKLEKGVKDGYESATRQLVAGSDIDIETFSVNRRDPKDMYAIGFEIGFLTKLAQ